MGLGFKGDTGHQHAVSENTGAVTMMYPISNGYFGKPGDSSDRSIRHIESEDPIATSKDFYDRLAFGGDERVIFDSKGNAKGTITKMADGTIITYREVSRSDGSPAVSINICHSNDSSGMKEQKIHFVKKKGVKK